jgi:geranylgeranyl diphosphate synthase type I
MTVTAHTLDRARDLLSPSLRAAVERLDDQLRPVVAYHLGWVDENGLPRTANAGKAVRPSLTLTVSEAVSGRAADGLPGAIAVELVHNFSLIHDDLMDRDTMRRHRPTVWALWGDSTAVLAGDALVSLAHEVLADAGTPHALAASAALARATRELIRGQALDMAFETRAEVGVGECLDMVAGKTGALLAVSAELGALLAGASSAAVRAFRGYGAELGVAFQLIDDLLGIWGQPEITGKPVYSDLLARKKTLPVAWALENGGATGRQLAAWLGSPEASADASHAADLVEASGGRSWAMAEARRRADAARASVAGLGLPGPIATQLAELAEFVVARQL